MVSPVLGCSAALLALNSAVQAEPCRLALVLALDVSSSVDESEYNLQREGLARALVDPEVAQAFLTGDPVALYVFEWASPSMQETVGPGWILVQSEGDLALVATALLSEPRRGTEVSRRSTAVGAALIHASSALKVPSDCRARTVDVSGDGRSNAGFEPRYVYANHPFDGVTVNALVVGGAAQGDTTQADEELVSWFSTNVLHGRHAFWILADGYEDFQRAMIEKLLRELEVTDVSGIMDRESAG